MRWYSLEECKLVVIRKKRKDANKKGVDLDK